MLHRESKRQKLWKSSEKTEDGVEGLTNMHLIGVQKGKERRKGSEAII